MNSLLLRKLGVRLLRLAVLFLIVVVALILLGQHSLIYFPRPYGASFSARLPKSAVTVRYHTSQGSQHAFWIPPREQAATGPEKIWAMFSGNGSVALDWDDFVARCPRTRDGFLLIDYPGYGQCKGAASPSAIEESSEKAVVVLAEKMGVNPDRKLNVIGHSIGCGAALNFAAHYPVENVILVAPFTSLRDMARRVVGWPLCYLLLHNFDNRARLDELAARTKPPRVSIFHGSSDEVIPSRMGRELAQRAPKMAAFHEVADADHGSIVSYAEVEIYAAMQ